MSLFRNEREVMKSGAGRHGVWAALVLATITALTTASAAAGNAAGRLPDEMLEPDFAKPVRKLVSDVTEITVYGSRKAP